VNISDWSDQDKRNVGSYLQWNSYRSERRRLLYVATPKVACTTLKWWFAALEGYAGELRKITDSSETDRDLIVHDSHKVAPNVTGLGLQDLREALESDSFFQFALVRNPYKRIFSAWQSKLLLREPLQAKPYVGTDFFHYPITTATGIAKAFEGFLEHLAENEAPSYWDHHWMPQADLLRPDLIRYSCLIKIEESEILTERLQEWLGTYIPSPFQGRRSNESLIPYAPELITRRSAELIGSLYSRDFDVFGYEKQIPSAKEEFSTEQFDVAIKGVKFIRARHQRLGERNEQIGGLNHALTQRDGQIAGLNQALTERDGRIAGLNHALAERDGQITGFSHRLAERDEQIAGLRRTLVERDVQIAALNRGLTERDGQIAGRSHALAERDGQIADLVHALSERDAQISRLNHALSERDAQISGLNHALAERDGKIHGLLQSHSWRFTKPLRLISSQVNAGIRPLRSAFNRISLRTPLIRQTKIRRVRLNPLFDPDFYAERNPDVVAAGVDLAKHYSFSGWKERRDPSAKFSTRHYLEIHPDVAAAGINPLLHYIEHGKAEGRQIRGAEDNSRVQPEHDDTPAAEAVALDDPPQGDLLDQVIDDTEAVLLASEPAPDPERIDAEIEAIRNSGLFDAIYYLAVYPDIQPPPADPIRHYCERGWHEGRNPSDDFNTLGYLEAYSDIKNARLNPFWHYVMHGRSESRQATPDSNSRYEDDIYFGELATDIRLIAYYATPDWSAVQHARNAVKGAGQALMPHEDLRFYAVSEPSTLARQALMARRHGVSAWCFSSDAAQSSVPGDPLREFLSNHEIDIGFILDIDLRSLLLDEQIHILLENALADERYLRIDGRPVLVMTLPDDDRDCDEVLTAFDVLLHHAPLPYRIARLGGLPGRAVGAAIRFKLDAALDFPISPIPGETGSFPPIHKNGGNFVPYSVVVSQGIARMGINDDHTVPNYRAVTLGRDDSPLKPNEPLRYTRYHLKEYRRWLDAAIADARVKHASDQRLLFINAWNDWNLGAVLEPDRFAGYSKLNETSRALLGLPLGLAMPKVSVIVPNYNHATYLQRRLESIYRQTYANIEVLLLDDCSTDQSRDVLSGYAGRYPNITTVLFNPKNSGGVFRQWAKGIKAATGDLIWVAESDDYCDEDFLEKLVRCFDDEAVMLAYSKIEFVRADETVMPDEFWQHVRDLDCRDKWKHSYVNTAHKEVSEALGIINTIPNASGAIFRRPVDMPLLEDERWLSMRVVGDWVFYLHQLRGGKIAYSTETTSYFRRYDGSTAASTYKKEIFYRELSVAAQSVQSLYETPSYIVEKFCSKVKEYYDFHGGDSDEEFRRWCGEKEILEARHLRTPNIAVSTMGFYPGGAEILPIRMANEFKRQGYSVVLLSADHGQREDGIRRLLRTDVPVIETSDVEFTKHLIHDFGIEVLNSHQWHVQKYPTQVSDVFGGLKAHVASLHGMIEYGDAFGVTVEQLRVADESVTTWVYTADKNLGPFIEHGLYQSDSSRFVKLPNGMEPPVIKPVSRAEIGIPDHAFVLCCVSRAIPDKGWTEAIEAVTQAREITGKDIHLILVGNGPVYDEYVHSGVPSFVYLAGFSENSVGFYAAADMGVMLTKFKSESFPLTIVDCLFAGRPYIATAVGEIRNMLTTDRGLAGEVIELKNWEVPVDVAARVIATYATDADALRSSREVVPEAANRYRIDVVVKQYVSIFDCDIEAQSSNAATAH
jgi:glycosyltransferase involved in cell wall biosynthesis